MKLKNILYPAVITTQLKGTDKEGVLRELLEMLVEAKQIPANKVEQVYEDLMEREKKMSTGIQHGVAIPHAKTKVVKNLVACIGLKKEGLDFASLDGEPSTIFIMTLSPVDRVGPHVQFLADISMVIKEANARKALLESKTAQDVLAVFGL
jgi:PTS system nitrogen regulatory IIA component